MYNPILNRMVRYYLQHVPVTEGKGRLLDMTRDAILPTELEQIAETKYGFSLHLNLANREHQRIYFYGEHDERYEIKVLRKLIQPTDVAWDIGANIGFYTCLFASLAPQGSVIAFEPVSGTRRLLENNVRLNRFNHVTVRSEALSNQNGTQEIFFQGANLGEGTASLVFTQGRGEKESVTVCRLDDIAADLPVPQVIKIDVEGCQREVWEGGKNFFISHDPIVLAELKDFSQNVESECDSLQQLVTSYGYQIFAILKHEVKPVTRLATTRGRNFLLVKEAGSIASRLKLL